MLFLVSGSDMSLRYLTVLVFRSGVTHVEVAWVPHAFSEITGCSLLGSIRALREHSRKHALVHLIDHILGKMA